MANTMADDDILRLLVDAADPAQFEALFKQYDGRMTVEFAQRAGGLWSYAVDAQKYGLGQRAAMISARVFLRNNKRAESIRAFFEYTQFQFLAANTPAEYDAARKAMRGIAEKALATQAPDTAFMALTRAAECCFFAVQGESDFYKQQDWMRLGVSDLVDASVIMPANALTALPNFFRTFVDVLCALFNNTRERVWFDPEMQGDWWRKLADVVERSVPVDYELPGPENHDKRRALAALSEGFGNPEVALKRLEFGMRA
jgi:hypothetical protein